MPTDAAASAYRYATEKTEQNETSDRSFPAGVGVALGVMAGTAFWVAILAVVFLL